MHYLLSNSRNAYKGYNWAATARKSILVSHVDGRNCITWAITSYLPEQALTRNYKSGASVWNRTQVLRYSTVTTKPVPEAMFRSRLRTLSLATSVRSHCCRHVHAPAPASLPRGRSRTQHQTQKPEGPQLILLLFSLSPTSIAQIN